MNEKIIYLELSSWTGISIGALHYYGKLVCGDTRIEVEYELDRTSAAMINRMDRVKTYRVGDMTGRFDREQDVIERALVIWKTHFPNGVILIKGHSATVGPLPVIAGPEKLTKRLNRINGRWEKHWRKKPRWDYEIDEITKKLEGEWEVTMKKVFGDVYW